MINYILDIREEFELKESRVIPNKKNVIVLNIPSRHLQFNIDFINNLTKDGKVFIICRSGNRSSQAKKKYFNSNNKIISLDFGTKDINKLNNFGLIRIESFNVSFIKSQGITQYMQLMFAIIMSLHALAIYKNVKREYILIFDIVFTIFILYQVMTKSCFLTRVLNYFKL